MPAMNAAEADRKYGESVCHNRRVGLHPNEPIQSCPTWHGSDDLVPELIAIEKGVHDTTNRNAQLNLSDPLLQLDRTRMPLQQRGKEQESCQSGVGPRSEFVAIEEVRRQLRP